MWILVFSIWAGCGPGVRFTGPTMLWGSLTGFCSVAANILLVRAMKHHEVGLCSTIYQLNLVPAAILAFLFLGAVGGGSAHGETGDAMERTHE